MLNKSYGKINLFDKALSASWQKNQVISNNIANVNTPNYKRQTVEFESLLQSAQQLGGPLSVTHENHISNNGASINPKIVQDSMTSFRRDGNNVNIDTEMALLAENQIRYETLTKQLNDNLKRLRISFSSG